MLDKKVVVYSSRNPLLSPHSFIQELFRGLKDSRELAWRLIVRDLSARYRQSIFGYLWAFLPPIATALLFIMLNKADVINMQYDNNCPYPVFVFSGIVLWMLFVDSLNAPLRVVGINKGMLSKINFPREAILLSGWGQVLIDFVIRLFILIVVFLIYKQDFQWTWLLFPFMALALTLLGTMLGIMLIPIGILYNDVASSLPIIAQLWFFITPVVYKIPQEGVMMYLFKYNPVTPLLSGTRDFLLNSHIENPSAFLFVTAISFFFLFIMWIIYKITLPILIERM